MKKRASLLGHRDWRAHELHVIMGKSGVAEFEGISQRQGNKTDCIYLFTTFRLNTSINEEYNYIYEQKR